MLDVDTQAAVRLPAGAPKRSLMPHVWSLFIDQVTGWLTTEFESQEIPSVLLKGRGLADLLYQDRSSRFYSDADLLIPPTEVPRAEELLRSLGFARLDRDEDWLGPEPKYAHTFRRDRDGAVIDLHWRLSGAMAPPALQWTKISEHTRLIDIGGRPVHVLDSVGGAVIVALHSAHHGTGRPLTLRDLDHAVEQLDLAAWRGAARLADELQASEPFAAGLRLTPAGDDLADRLGLDRPFSVEMWLKTNPRPYGAYVLDRITQTKGFRDRLVMCVRVALPPPPVMYRVSPLARRGRFGLALAYLLRPFQLIVHAGPALRDLKRARRALRANRRLAREPH